MKRLVYTVIAVIMVISLAGCSTKAAPASQSNTAAASGTAGTETASSAETSQAPAETSAAASETSAQANLPADPDTKLLQSASVDLDGDGVNEEIQIFQKTIQSQDPKQTDQLEGYLKVTGKDGAREIPFIKKSTDVTEVASSLEFKDLDGDGVKDIFIELPDYGASFSLDYFYIYNYKTGKSYSYVSDIELADFAGSFAFTYMGGGKLRIENEKYKLSATFDITGGNGTAADDTVDSAYENSWVEPSPVEMGEESRLALVSAADGKAEIKVPLPVFGLSTADLIGEIDLYYRVDTSFKPVMDHFTVVAINDGKLNQIAECVINS